MDSHLLTAYNNTSYNVFEPALSIKIGQRNPELDTFLKSMNHKKWAFITACNPFSKIVSDRENEERHHQLKEQIKEYPFFEGEGKGMDTSWKPERSFLILGISETDAVKLGRYFEQNAIVLGSLKEHARLLLV
ncbi:DUF3293 domain-containing protein [Christiangramia sp.]|uniref:DUF3293 domain-containing protein n=1 Tax=Christiangramia sp. TaxID=1931228 RepID=UPI002629A37A|nr:DUF3293 domain-containing protein [Christiangramia sp.]